MAKVTLQTVADTVGVSRMTVSNAFSRPDQLSRELRERVLAAAEELGYVGPDPSARALARGSTGTVGVVLTASVDAAFRDEVATQFLGSIASQLAPAGLSLTLLSAGTPGGRVPARDVPMDGALVYNCDLSSPVLDWLERRKLPLVLVDQEPDPRFPSVNVDDRGGAAQAAQHLMDLGHRRIGVVAAAVAGPHGLGVPLPSLARSYVTAQRILGWRDVLTPGGIEPTVVTAQHSTAEEGYRGFESLFRADPSITGVLCFSDTLAHGVLLAAHDRGLRIPEDLSVVGFDDNPLAARLRPGLTTVRQDLREKGRLAITALIREIGLPASGNGSGSDAATCGPEASRRVWLPTELVVRQSAARPAD